VNASSPGTISVLVVRALVVGGMALGLQPNELAKLSGVPEDVLSPEVLADPDARVSSIWVLRLWEYLPRRAEEENFGLWLAERLNGAPLTVAWWVILASATLGEGLSRALRYQRLLHDGARSEIIRSPDEVIYRHQVGAPPFRPPRDAIEFGFASLIQLAQRATGRDIAPKRVTLQHQAPGDLARHRRFFGPGLSFDEAHDEVVFTREQLGCPLVTADDTLREVVEAHARELVARLPHADKTGDRVRVAICDLLRDGPPRGQTVARRLGMPLRTLQRRLREEDTTLAALIDGVRFELAERYLSDARISTQEAAFLLGFSDVSAFHRAFVRWTGVTPAEYRSGARAPR
jgi:AraC-like DNA-binding protein